MNLLHSFIEEAFEDHKTHLSIEIVINGKAIEALPAETEIAPSLDIGGVSDHADGMVVCKKNDLGNMPKIGTRITINSEVARISAIYKQPNPALVTIAYSGVSER